MSGFDDSGAPPEVPEEYAAVYRDAYLRALAEDADAPAGPLEAAPAGDDVRATGLNTASWLRPALAIAVVLVVVGGGFAVSGFLSGEDEPATGPSIGVPEPSRTAPARRPRPDRSVTPSSPALSSAAVWDGAVTAIVPLGVEATCTSDPGVDSAGKAVSYVAANATDGDASTAWRCDGRAVGVALTLRLPADVDVAEVGLIPGYAKTDAKSGVDRYAENNRITRVRWTLGEGVVVEQELDPAPGDRSMQLIRVPRTASGTITLEVLSVERGPRNTTAISEIAVAAAG